MSLWGEFAVRSARIFALCCLLAGASPLFAKQSPEPTISAEQAREEANLVFARIVGKHPDAFWHTGDAEWQEAFQDLARRTEPVSHAEHFFALAKFMSMAFDTHTQIYPEADTPGFQTSYPIRFRLFEEGVYVTAAGEPYRDWVGLKLISVAGQPIEQVISNLATISFADHPQRKRNWGVEYWMPHPAVYRHFGWMDQDGSVAVELAHPDGRTEQLRLKSTSQQSYDSISRSGSNTAYFWPKGWRTLNDLAQAPPPLSRSRLDENYWFTEIADGEMIYVQLNRPFDAAGGETLFDFWLRLFQQISANHPKYKRLILDVRYDLGGSISFSLPAPYLAHASYLCCKPGGLVLLTGRETVSAGAVIVGEFERASRPITIGEPTGSRPNIFYNHTQIPLPHSGLFAEASTSKYLATVESDKRVMIAPDMATPESITAVLQGRDLALEAAIALTSEQAEAFYSRGRNYESWIRPSQDAAQPIAQ